ncbi:MAG: homoserine dehydrogenase, partial [Clostridiales bacterium]|nr:homoserine dehydrogenase [Clostridiales bacterium]
MVQVAIMGYGTIGSGVAEILEKNRDAVAAAAGEEVVLKYVLDLREFPGSPVEDKLIHEFHIIEEDPEIDVVVETMGGLNPSYPFVKASLLAGKHVATSNKALVAAYGTELLAIAREKGVNFFFEASVGGGIPIIRPLYRCLSGEKIEEITGILNGTTNYILTKMDQEGASFEDALKEAQELGYAERNPEADIEGYDSCRKIAILTAMATGHEVNFEDIYTEGITKITDVDFQYAERLGASIKLFGSSRMSGDEVHAWVAPVMIGRSHPLYAVSDVFNGILVKGNMLGVSMFYGSGAGKLPTASAVVADIIEAVQNKHANVKIGWDEKRLAIADMGSAS